MLKRGRGGRAGFFVTCLFLAFVISGCNVLPLDAILNMFDRFKKKPSEGQMADEASQKLSETLSSFQETLSSQTSVSGGASASSSGAAVPGSGQIPVVVTGASGASVSGLSTAPSGGSVVVVPVGAGVQAAPPAAFSDMVARSIGFSPRNSGGRTVNRLRRAEAGDLVSVIENRSARDVNVEIEISVDGRPVRSRRVFIDANSSKVYDFPYTFNDIGDHLLRLDVNADRAVAEDGPGVGDNNTVRTGVTVVEDAARGDDGALLCRQFGLRKSGEDVETSVIGVGETGVIYAFIGNNGRESVIGTRLEFALDETLLTTRTVNVGGGEIAETSVTHTFSEPGTHTIKMAIDPQNRLGRFYSTAKMIQVQEAAPELTRIDPNPPPALVRVPLPDIKWKRAPRFIKSGPGQEVVTQVAVGEMVQVKDDFMNAGPGGAGEFIVKAEMPGGEPFSASTFIARDGLAAGEKKTFATPFFSYDSAGTKRVELVIDPENRLTQETSRSNNTQVCSIRVRALTREEANRPNLKAISIKACAPGTDREIHTAAAGTPVDLVAVIRNASNVPVRNAHVEIRRVSDNTLIRDFFVNVVANQEAPARVTRVFDTPGFIQFKMTIDPEGASIENERLRTDNTVNNYIEITAAQVVPVQSQRMVLENIRPDARACGISFAPAGRYDAVTQAYVGETGTIYAQLRNDAGVEISDLKAEIRVDGRVIKEEVHRIGAGSTVRFQVDNFSFAQPGRHQLSLVLDPQDDVLESVETNNVMTCTVDVLTGRRPQTRTPDVRGDQVPAETGVSFVDIVSVFSDVGAGAASSAAGSSPAAAPTVIYQGTDTPKSPSTPTSSSSKTGQPLVLKTYE